METFSWSRWYHLWTSERGWLFFYWSVRVHGAPYRLTQFFFVRGWLQFSVFTSSDQFSYATGSVGSSTDWLIIGYWLVDDWLMIHLFIDFGDWWLVDFIDHCLSDWLLWLTDLVDLVWLFGLVVWLISYIDLLMTDSWFIDYFCCFS